MESDNPNKSAILETSLSLFAAKGYESSGVQEIVTLCGITKPTLYYYFGSKTGILEEIIRTHGSVYAAAVSKASGYDHDLVRHITLCLTSVTEAAVHDPDFFRLYSTALFSGRETELFKSFSCLRAEIQSYLDTLFVSSAAEFGNMRGYETLYSRTFRFLAESTALEVLNGELKLTDDIIYKIVHSFMYGVAN